MPNVTCPNCSEELDIPTEFLGREVRCATCQRVFVPPKALDISTVRKSTQPSDDAENAALAEPKPRKKRRSPVGWLVIVFGLMSCCGVGCAGSVVLFALIANPQFQTYDAADGTFSAAFPTKPKLVNDTTDDGQHRVSVEARRRFPPEFYFVQHVEIAKPGDAEELLRIAADQSVKKVLGGTEVRRTNSTVDGYPALDVMIEHGNGQQTTLVRHVIAGKRLYTLGIVGPHGLDFSIEYVDRFFSSFQIKKKT